MASISIAGSSSGLDKVVGITPSVAIDRSAIDQRMAEPAQTPSPTQLSSAGKLQGALAEFLDSAQKLTLPETWSATVATSSDPAAVAAATETSAAVGNHQVKVHNLAQAQSTSSTTFSGVGTVIGLGTLHFEIGTWNSSQSTFATNPNWPKADVSVGPHDDSLEKVRDKINAAGVGVVATVVSSSTGSRLVLRSTATGMDNGFKVTASGASPTEAAEASLAALGFDPSSVSGREMTLTQEAADAHASVDDTELSSPSNTLSDTKRGLVLQLKQVTAEPVSITVEPDKDAIKKSITDFTEAYNGLQSTLTRQLSGMTEPGQSVQSHMRSIVGQHPQAGPLSKWLSEMGVSLETAGTLKVDHQKLDDVIGEQIAKTKPMFSHSLSRSAANQASANGPEAGQQTAAELALKTKLAAQYTAIDQSLKTDPMPIAHVVQKISTLGKSG